MKLIKKLVFFLFLVLIRDIFIIFSRFYFLLSRICHYAREINSSFTILFLTRVTSIRLSAKTRRGVRIELRGISVSNLTRYRCRGDGRSRAIEKSRITLERMDWKASGNGPNARFDSQFNLGDTRNSVFV